MTTAKIVAALLFGVLAFTLHILVAFGIPLVAFGIDGWNLPLQINGTTVPYPFTFLEGTLINLGVIYLVLIAMIGVTLFLSARMKSPYFVLIVVVPVLFIPMVPFSEWNHWNLQFVCTFDTVSITGSSFQLVSFLSVRFRNFGRFCHERTCLCDTDIDFATSCEDRL